MSQAVLQSIDMARDVSVRELRRPVADILPHVEDRDPWVPSAELRRIVREAPVDSGLLKDLAEVRGAELDDV